MIYSCKNFLYLSGITLLGLFFSVPAYADVGIPMLVVTMPLMALALIPVIIIEGFVLLRYLQISKKLAFKAATTSNLLSTFVGIPITWLCLVIIQIITGGGSAYGINTLTQKLLAITWQAPWLIPYESELGWMVPTAIAVLLIPFFFISWFVEYKVTKKILKKIIEKSLINKAVFVGNLITYIMLELLVLARLIWVLIYR